jgi:hypothetical protein
LNPVISLFTSDLAVVIVSFCLTSAFFYYYYIHGRRVTNKMVYVLLILYVLSVLSDALVTHLGLSIDKDIIKYERSQVVRRLFQQRGELAPFYVFMEREWIVATVVEFLFGMLMFLPLCMRGNSVDLKGLLASTLLFNALVIFLAGTVNNIVFLLTQQVR